MQERMHEAFGMVAPLALRRMMSLLDADSENVQLEASKQLLDRAGYGRRKEDDQQIHQIGKGEIKVIIDLRAPSSRNEGTIIEGERLPDRDPLLPADNKPLAISRPIKGSEI